MARSPALPVALIQMSCVADPARNVQTALSHVAQAARGGAKLVCLPELFRSLYFCQKQDYKCFQLAEPIPGPTTQLLSAAAKKHKITLVSSLFEKRTGGLYHNTAVVFGPNGKILGTYRKMHIPDDPGFNEKFYFTPGDTGFQPIDTPVGRLGILVCWDQWYPEAARLMALRGAQILIYPTAIGWARGEKKMSAKPSETLGKPSKEATQLPMGFLSYQSIALDGRIISISGAHLSSATPWATWWRRLAPIAPKSFGPHCNYPKRPPPVSTGLSCGIVESMPTPVWINDSSVLESPHSQRKH